MTAKYHFTKYFNIRISNNYYKIIIIIIISLYQIIFIKIDYL